MAWNNINLDNPFSKARQSSLDHHRTFCSCCFHLPLYFGGGKWLYHPNYCILRNKILCWRCNISQYPSTLSKRVTTVSEQSCVLCNSGTCWDIFVSGRIFNNLFLGLHSLTATFPRPAQWSCPDALKTTVSHMLNHCRMLPALNEWEGNDSLL